jgi:PiT family inorganic phosphate transporter
VPMVLSPLIGFAAGYLAMVGVLWLFRRAAPGPLTRRFRLAQIGSSAGMALGHGLQDAQKTMGVITLALVAAGYHHGSGIPLWVTLSAASAISLGTASGGWRVMRTLGRRVIELDPPHGFVAETVGAVILYITAFVFRAPVSTTHVITSAITGVGATRRRSAVRWGVAGDIAIGWVLTMPAAGAVAAGISWLLRA